MWVFIRFIVLSSLFIWFLLKARLRFGRRNVGVIGKCFIFMRRVRLKNVILRRRIFWVISFDFIAIRFLRIIFLVSTSIQIVIFTSKSIRHPIFFQRRNFITLQSVKVIMRQNSFTTSFWIFLLNPKIHFDIHSNFSLPSLKLTSF